MLVRYYDWEIDVLNESVNSEKTREAFAHYQIEYSNLLDNGRLVQPSSLHGIRVSKDGKEISSAILLECCGATGIHTNSFIIRNDVIFICCSDKVYALHLPNLKLKWMKSLDPFTSFAIHRFENDFIIHGELNIFRVDEEGNIKWKFGGKDIFVNTNGKKEFEIIGDKIHLTDWENNCYILDGNGKEISKS